MKLIVRETEPQAAPAVESVTGRAAVEAIPSRKFRMSPEAVAARRRYLSRQRRLRKQAKRARAKTKRSGR